MSDYPIPSYAATFWIAGNDLMIAFPGPSGKSHTVRLPISEAGLKTAITILRDRAHATDLRISNKGTPAQWDLENDARYRALIKARREEKEAARISKAEAEAFLKELGL